MTLKPKQAKAHAEQTRHAFQIAATFADMLAYGEDADYFAAWGAYFRALAMGKKCEAPK